MSAICNTTQLCNIEQPKAVPVEKKNKMVGMGVGLALGLGVPVLLLVGFLIFRCSQEKQVMQSMQQYNNPGEGSSYHTSYVWQCVCYIY